MLFGDDLSPASRCSVAHSTQPRIFRRVLGAGVFAFCSICQLNTKEYSNFMVLTGKWYAQKNDDAYTITVNHVN